MSTYPARFMMMWNPMAPLYDEGGEIVGFDPHWIARMDVMCPEFSQYFGMHQRLESPDEFRGNDLEAMETMMVQEIHRRGLKGKRFESPELPKAVQRAEIRILSDGMVMA